MAASSEVVHCYGQLASTMSLMAQLARAKEWERLPELEAQCAIVVEQLQRIAPSPMLDPMQLAQAHRLLTSIRADQDQVRSLVEPQLKRLVSTMGHLQKQNDLGKAYGLPC